MSETRRMDCLHGPEASWASNESTRPWFVLKTLFSSSPPASLGECSSRPAFRRRSETSFVPKGLRLFMLIFRPTDGSSSA
ncbi:hypothetical protein ACFPRL_22890 [Pseudoclavibacter helvolus]